MFGQAQVLSAGFGADARATFFSGLVAPPVVALPMASKRSGAQNGSQAPPAAAPISCRLPRDRPLLRRWGSTLGVVRPWHGLSGKKRNMGDPSTHDCTILARTVSVASPLERRAIEQYNFRPEPYTSGRTRNSNKFEHKLYLI